ncbi:MAG: hypothetical protein AB8B56_20060 [Crocinitomicaceae bacterium]
MKTINFFLLSLVLLTTASCTKEEESDYRDCYLGTFIVEYSRIEIGSTIYSTSYHNETFIGTISKPPNLSRAIRIDGGTKTLGPLVFGIEENGDLYACVNVVGNMSCDSLSANYSDCPEPTFGSRVVNVSAVRQ